MEASRVKREKTMRERYGNDVFKKWGKKRKGGDGFKNPETLAKAHKALQEKRDADRRLREGLEEMEVGYE